MGVVWFVWFGMLLGFEATSLQAAVTVPFVGLLLWCGVLGVSVFVLCLLQGCPVGLILSL